MQFVRGLPWAQVGESVQAFVACDFSIDVDWQIEIGGSLGSDYYAARSMDVNGYVLAAGVFVTMNFNQNVIIIPAAVFQTYTLAPHQRYINLTASAGAPNVLNLTFYPIARPEWR